MSAIRLGSHESIGSEVSPAGSAVVLRSSIPVTSSPSVKPSSSESASSGSVPASSSSALVKPSPSWSQVSAIRLGSHESIGSEVSPAGSAVVLRSSIPVTSSPSVKPSSSESASSGSVPASSSSALVKPSPSWSQVSAVKLGSHGLRGSELSSEVKGLSSVPLYSSSSVKPSPSVSGLVGSVPIAASSSFVKPSWSWSHASAKTFGSQASFGPEVSPAGFKGVSGLSAPVISSPSSKPSLSLSGLVGSVPATISSSFVKPSSSWSQDAAVTFGSQGLRGLELSFVVLGSLSVPLISSPSLIPSPSESGFIGLVL